jgi:hypothetical protein
MSIEQVPHSFHIPVMGIGFTIDTPIKVAPYGISSVISLVDDILIEKMREFYSRKLHLPFVAISEKADDFRARRITAYLDLVDSIVNTKFAELKESIDRSGEELARYIDLLPDFSSLRKKFTELAADVRLKPELKEWVRKYLRPGSIDVNIMTKLDRTNYRDGEPLPAEFNDAQAALRGYARSGLRSSIVFSAGMNPRLYGYLEEFDDFYPDGSGNLKKKIILKVSDYRSAIIQGKFLAKKGLWVSEYRIESGLNCGGHAFATDGYLLGPILEEFRANRVSLVQSTHEMLVEALKGKGRVSPDGPLPVRISAQGGVGTAEEHRFLLEHYGIDSVGWGSPFLLVPEAVNVDGQTLDLLTQAKEEDLYLSNTSPLGVPFNTLRGNTKDLEKEELIAKGRPGSSCPKKYCSLNTEFTDKAICVASRQYQHLKIRELGPPEPANPLYRKAVESITEKSCICVGLGTSALLVNGLATKVEGEGVSVCPGPNIAYFSRVASLREMVGHIYGRASLIDEERRPNMFVKELQLYVDYVRNRFDESPRPLPARQIKYFAACLRNLEEGVEYYRRLFSDFTAMLAAVQEDLLATIGDLKGKVGMLEGELQ